MATSSPFSLSFGENTVPVAAGLTFVILYNLRATLSEGQLGSGQMTEGGDHDSHLVISHENKGLLRNSKVRTET